MTEVLDEKTCFLESIAALRETLRTDDPLFSFRQKHDDLFLTLQLPDRHLEVYRYVNRIRQLYAKGFSRAQKTAADLTALLDEHEIALVFINGFYAPEWSKLGALKDRVIAQPLSRSVLTYEIFLESQTDRAMAQEKDPFAALNGAFFGEGLFLYVPPKTVIEETIAIVNVVDSGDADLFIMPRLHVVAGKESEFSLEATQQVVSGSRSTMNGYVSLTLDDGARVSYTQALVNGESAGFHFEAVRVVMKRDSVFHGVQAVDGSETMRHDWIISMMGSNGEANISGVAMLDDTSQAHTNVLIEHVAPNCRSQQLFKNVLHGKSRSSFEGKIFVHPEAQKTDAFQLNNNLLLSDGVQADSKPNLEIFADDVKASHGATFGQLDREQLFYLKTRGFSDRDAKNLLVRGFCQDVIDKIACQSLREKVSARGRRYIDETT